MSQSRKIITEYGAKKEGRFLHTSGVNECKLAAQLGRPTDCCLSVIRGTDCLNGSLRKRQHVSNSPWHIHQPHTHPPKEHIQGKFLNAPTQSGTTALTAPHERLPEAHGSPRKPTETHQRNTRTTPKTISPLPPSLLPWLPTHPSPNHTPSPTRNTSQHVNVT